MNCVERNEKLFKSDVVTSKRETVSLVFLRNFVVVACIMSFLDLKTEHME